MIQVEHELCLFLDPERSRYISFPALNEFLFLLYTFFLKGGGGGEGVEGGSKSSLDIFFITITPPHSSQ